MVAVTQGSVRQRAQAAKEHGAGASAERPRTRLKKFLGHACGETGKQDDDLVRFSTTCAFTVGPQRAHRPPGFA